VTAVPDHIVIMGVSGSGKTTVGQLLGAHLGLPYCDGDDLHPQANIDKMAAGTPLTDEDRWPWLELVGKWLADHPEGGIIGCSSLRRSYRDLIRRAAPEAVFIHVHGTPDVLGRRMSHRPGHFMPTSLLDSQLEALEMLGEDEKGQVFNIAHSPGTLVEQVADWLHRGATGPR
jgi:gluconokinase